MCFHKPSFVGGYYSVVGKRFLSLHSTEFMKMAASNLLCLLVMLSLSLEGVKSQQRFPYVSFRGQTLDNHSYVDISEVGDDYYSDSVQCHTDLSTCCSYAQGPHRGDWYFPNGTRLPFSRDIYESRGAQRVALHRRNNANSPVGIYRCDIQTNAGYNSVRDTVYVGMYTASGGMLISSLLVLLTIMHGSDSGQQSTSVSIC